MVPVSGISPAVIPVATPTKGFTEGGLAFPSILRNALAVLVTFETIEDLSSSSGSGSGV